MTNHHKLVNYFANNFYTPLEDDVSFIASHKFRFRINNGPPMGFEDYEARKKHVFNNAKLEVAEFKSTDDRVFVAQFTLNQPDLPTQNGFCQMTVENGLLLEVHLRIKELPKVLDDFDQLQQSEMLMKA